MLAECNESLFCSQSFPSASVLLVLSSVFQSLSSFLLYQLYHHLSFEFTSGKDFFFLSRQLPDTQLSKDDSVYFYLYFPDFHGCEIAYHSDFVSLLFVHILVATALQKKKYVPCFLVTDLAYSCFSLFSLSFFFFPEGTDHCSSPNSAQ